MLSRQYILEKYAELLGLPKEDTICINLEKSTYNTTLREQMNWVMYQQPRIGSS